MQPETTTTYQPDGRLLTDGGQAVGEPSDEDAHPFDVATDAATRVNRMLADTEGAICSMSFQGAIGYHYHVATGETSPEYLWKIALLEALDDQVFQTMWVDADDAVLAREQIERQLRDHIDPFTTEAVADAFEENLQKLIEVQEEAEVAEDGDSA